MRVGDRDRARTVRRIRAGYLRGEVSAETFESRVGLALAARSDLELHSLEHDLPTPALRLRRALDRLRARIPHDQPLQLQLPSLSPGARLSVGRSSVADIRLPDATVSRLHAELRRTDAGWLCVDLHSTNGTLLNGRRVSRAHLHDGDDVILGGIHLRVVAD